MHLPQGDVTKNEREVRKEEGREVKRRPGGNIEPPILSKLS